MFFKSNIISVDFTINEIFDYQNTLNSAKEKAFECFQDAITLSEQIRQALEEIIEAGHKNLEVCMEQIEFCNKEREVSQAKIKDLVDIRECIAKNLYTLDEMISQAYSNYKSACANADAIHYQTAKSEAEEAARQQALSAAQKQVARLDHQVAQLNDKRSKLYNFQNEVEANISKLQNICDMQLYQIDMHLQQEQSRIETAIRKAEELIDRLADCKLKLKESFSRDIDGDLHRCMEATARALSYANEAVDCMSILNDRGYTSYDRITVNNVGALLQETAMLEDTLAEMVRQFQDIYRIEQIYDDLLQDKIMAASLGLLKTVSEDEKEALTYMKKKIPELNRFCQCLLRYSQHAQN